MRCKPARRSTQTLGSRGMVGVCAKPETGRKPGAARFCLAKKAAHPVALAKRQRRHAPLPRCCGGTGGADRTTMPRPTFAAGHNCNSDSWLFWRQGVLDATHRGARPTQIQGGKGCQHDCIGEPGSPQLRNVDKRLIAEGSGHLDTRASRILIHVFCVFREGDNPTSLRNGYTQSPPETLASLIQRIVGPWPASISTSTTR